MKKSLIQIAMVVALGSGLALAQGMGQQQAPGTTPPTLPQSQQQTPPTTDQSPNSPSATSPSTAPDQGQPSTTDQKSGSMSGQNSAKLPQSDASASDSASIQSSIQSALQQDSTLANDKLKVKVTDKKVNLSGKVNSEEEKQKAEQIASSNAGGREVKDHIKVAKSGAMDNDKDKDKNQNPGAYPKK
jgi:hypothetical protein